MNARVREIGVYAFGRFRLDPTRRTLVDSFGEVALTARLFDTLLYLVQNPDRLVGKDELARAVWADRAVAEGNLQKAVSSLVSVRRLCESGESVSGKDGLKGRNLL